MPLYKMCRKATCSYPLVVGVKSRLNLKNHITACNSRNTFHHLLIKDSALHCTTTTTDDNIRDNEVHQLLINL